MQPTTVAMTCACCGEMFEGNPQSQPLGSENYCSLLCEEGRRQAPPSDPTSPDYWLYLQGNPESLVGQNVVVSGLKYCDYSPDWHRTPWQYSADERVWFDEETQEMVVKHSRCIGRVDAYEDGEYRICHYDEEWAITHYRWWDSSLVVSQIRSGRWWAEE